MALPELVLQIPDWPPDPILNAERYRGVTLRRILAYLIDAAILGLLLIGGHALLAVLTVMSFGLLWPLHALFLPIVVALAYHSLLIGGPGAATIGMRIAGIRVHTMLGGRPSLLQAFVQTVCFYLTTGFSGGILLLVALFNPRRRTLHDYLAGTLILRDEF